MKTMLILQVTWTSTEEVSKQATYGGPIYSKEARVQLRSAGRLQPRCVTWIILTINDSSMILEIKREVAQDKA